MDATLFPMALAGLGVTFYTHLRLGDYIRGDWQTLALRLFLAIIGIGVGLIAVYTIAEPAPVLPFLIGFGLVHLPPALVLILKRMRGESPS